MSFRMSVVLSFGLLLLVAGFGVAAAPQGTAFTYQGELKQAGQPANGLFDFEVGLYLQGAGGVPLDVLQLDDVMVTDGIFTFALDFTAVPFEGDQTWLGIGVRAGASSGGFTGLLPRQALTSVPYALNARSVEAGAIDNAAIASSSVGSLEIIDHSITAADLAANSVGATELANNSVDSAAIIDGTVAAVDLASNSVDASKIVDGSITAADLAANSVGATQLADNSVDSAAIINGAVAAVDIADGSIGTTKIIDSQVQRRVSGSCPTGEYLAGINQDGSVLCQMLPVGLGYNPDSAGAVGYFSSIAVRSTGFPIISYYD